MKKVMLSLAAALFVFASCEEVKELANFRIGQTFDYTVNLMVGDNDPTEFSEEVTIDTSVDPNFKDNASKIANYSVGKFELSIPMYQGADGIMADGEISFMADGAVLGAPITMPQIDFKKLNESGEMVEVIIPEETKTQIENNLKNANAVTIQMKGQVSDKPVNADIAMAIRIDA
jgi:hypothetical protein